MSKELTERIKAFKSRQYDIAKWCHDDAVGLLVDCQERIKDLQFRVDAAAYILPKMNALEQENSRLQGRVEAEAQSGMQSLRTQENLFGAKLDALQAELDGWKDGSEAAQNEYAALILRSNHKIGELEQENARLQAQLQTARQWRKCKTHGDIDGATQWGCPDCVFELRGMNHRLQARVDELEKILSTGSVYGIPALDAIANCQKTIRDLQAQLEAASGYLGRLLTTVWPQIELCPDLMGICTQIDHLLGSQRDKLAAGIAAHEARIEELEKDRDEWRKSAEGIAAHHCWCLEDREKRLRKSEQENTRLQAALEAAEGLLRELNETSTVLTEKLIAEYFRAKEGKEKP